MTTKDDGGPAFPQDGTALKFPDYASAGMSLRDWFAGQALAGLIGDQSFRAYARSHAGKSGPAIHAEAAYQVADAMLAERSKP